MAKQIDVEALQRTVDQHEQAISELTELLEQMLVMMKLGQIDSSQIRARIRSVQTLLKKPPTKKFER